MGANSHSPSDADSPDTDARIDAKSPAANRLNDTTEMVAAALVASGTDYHGQTRFFEDELDGTDDALDGFVADVTTIVQSQCKRATDSDDNEMLVFRLPNEYRILDTPDTLA